MNLPVLGASHKWAPQDLPFPRSTMPSRRMHGAACVGISVFVEAKSYAIVWREHTSLIRHPGMDTWVVPTFWLLWTWVYRSLLQFFWVYPQQWHCRSCGHPMFHFLRTHQTGSVAGAPASPLTGFFSNPVFFLGSKPHRPTVPRVSDTCAHAEPLPLKLKLRWHSRDPYGSCVCRVQLRGPCRWQPC